MNDEQQPKHRRSIRSFVMRAGRMTVGQQRAYDQFWPRYGLKVADGALALQDLFGRDAPVVLEIGFGMGKSLADMAEAEPEKDFIGVEVHPPGVGSLLMEVEKRGLTNVRVYAEDAVEVMEHCVPAGSLARVQLYFPDPWHKKRHHKRRLVQPAFVQSVRGALEIGGLFHLATDWENYAEHMLDVMETADGFRNQMGPAQYVERPAFRPETKFERRGQRLGHGVWDLLYERID